MRASPKKVIKAVFVISSLFFVLVNINFLLSDEDYSADEERERVRSWLDENTTLKLDSFVIRAEPEGNVQFVFNREEMLNRLNETRYSVLNISQFSHSNTESFLLPRQANLSEIMRATWEVNRRQQIRNLDKFDVVASGATIVIVVQVHNRTDYLRYLVNSLSKCADIEQTLLIFSHDFYSDDLNDIVNSVDFCLVMQIFYPYSQQLHPHVFPGEDPRDCPRNFNKDQAMEIGCQNKDYPDKYGHYREAKYTQTKQHWFWKINHVFEFMDITRTFNGPVLFIEEDHYLVPDFISVLRMMYRLKSRACIDCNIITLGTYDKKPSYGSNSPKVDIMNWISSKHNMGMSMTRETWDVIKACGEPFCRFDDYNWDWSLHYIGMSCIPSKLRVMVMKSPRIYHIGECGLHAKGKNCNPADRVEHIESLLDENSKSLFPQSLVVGGYPSAPRRVPKPNGGWGDLRDHELCISLMNSPAHR